MSYIVVDVEADGQAPSLYSMVCFGAVIVNDQYPSFYSGLLVPISENYNPDALAVSGFSREDMEKDGNSPTSVMERFDQWIKDNSKGNPIFISDNNGFDWQFINYYFHRYLGRNPFGWSSRRLADLWCGFEGNSRYRWKKHRKTKHTHHPVDDAKGNAEALMELQRRGLKIKLN